MKLRIRNHTRYLTADLRRLILAGLRAAGCSEPKVVDVHPARSWHTGRANYSIARPGEPGFREGRWMRLNLPGPGRLNVATAALLVLHEAQHTRGAKHGDMTDAVRTCVGPRPSWAKGLELRQKAPPARPTMAECVDAREASARAHLAAWQAKEQRATARVKYWLARVRYYDRRRRRGHGVADDAGRLAAGGDRKATDS